MVIRLSLLLMLLCSFESSALNRLTASVDKNPAMAGESILLSVEADEQLNTNALDLDPLRRQFMVGRASTNRQTQAINGNVTHATIWTVTLVARQPGNYHIPAFTIDGVSTNPIDIKVIKASQQGGSGSPKVFLKNSVDKQSVYLQSTISLTLKLYMALEMQSGSITEPTMENANIEKLPKDQESTEILDGVRYRVVTRHYSVTPQRSGNYQITAPIFNGEMVISQRRSLFSGFNNTKPISAMGEAIDIEVKPIPDEYSGQWLPSDFVALSEQWEPKEQTYRVGDPITRIVTLSAAGISEEQLPEIEVTYPAEVKTYPDQSTLHSANRGGQLISQRKDSVAIIPNKAGPLILPEIKVPWWNTRTNTMEYATLPAKTLQIEAAKGGQQTYLPPVPVASAPAPVSGQAPVTVEQIATHSYLTWGFLAAWLTTLLLWFLHVRRLTASGIQVKAPEASDGATNGKTYWNEFSKACKANQPAAANAQLLRWGRARWPEQSFTASVDVARYLGNPQLITAINDLQAHLYADKEQSWDGKALLAIAAKAKSPKQTAAPEGLSPLHPA